VAKADRHPTANHKRRGKQAPRSTSVSTISGPRPQKHVEHSNSANNDPAELAAGKSMGSAGAGPPRLHLVPTETMGRWAMLQKTTGTAVDDHNSLSLHRLFLQAVRPADHCTLGVALLWVAIQRLPIWDYDEHLIVSCLSKEECDQLGIPQPPDGVYYDTPRAIESLLIQLGLPQPYDGPPPQQIVEAQVEQEQFARWRESFRRATEPHAAEIYLALRKGHLPATGKLLPTGISAEEFLANKHLAGRPSCLSSQPLPPEVWTQAGIDWLSSAVTVSGECYCDIKVPVPNLFSIFPAPLCLEEQNVYRVGDSYVIDLAENTDSQKSQRRSGRPPLVSPTVWDAFHVEVARLIKHGQFPNKKEAAIGMMTEWFERQYGRSPGRTTIGAKLTQYCHAMRTWDTDGNSDPGISD